ncbi:hypothetical protein HOD08_04730 [bacterium]|jgi:hypothetical protein|nr:hypothetical protein [bacterium]
MTIKKIVAFVLVTGIVASHEVFAGGACSKFSTASSIDCHNVPKEVANFISKGGRFKLTNPTMWEILRELAGYIHTEISVDRLRTAGKKEAHCFCVSIKNGLDLLVVKIYENNLFYDDDINFSLKLKDQYRSERGDLFPIAVYVASEVYKRDIRKVVLELDKSISFDTRVQDVVRKAEEKFKSDWPLNMPMRQIIVPFTMGQIVESHREDLLKKIN